MRVVHNKYDEYIADEGYVLTDGNSYCNQVRPAPSISIDNWEEIPIEQIPIQQQVE